MKIRPHHLLCIPRFKGGGYTKEFREEIRRIQKEIINKPNKEITISPNVDTLCKKCPHKSGNNCIKEEKINPLIRLQDKEVMKKLKIKENSKLNAKEIFLSSIKNINNNNLKDICKGCEFLPCCLKYGLNMSFVNKLNKK